MTNGFRKTLEACKRAWRCAKPMLAWKWGEEHVTLDHTSPMPGRYRTNLTPMVRYVLTACQNNILRKVVILCSAQSAKTQTIMVFLAWLVKNDPGPCFWLMAAHDDAKEFAQTRLLPMLESIPELEDVMPTGRGSKNKVLVQFATMNLMFRGSNSKSKLQSTPVRYLILDEVRNYTKGALELVLKRIVAWWNSCQIWISTAGDAHDEMDIAYGEGTQTHFYFNCLKCGHPQPLRFGRVANPVFPNERKKGGLRWDENEKTRPGGKWNWKEWEKTVRFECEECEHPHRETDRGRILESLFPVDTNENPEPRTVSFWWNALYIPWIPWAEVGKEFLKALKAWERGQVEPLKAWVRESDGCPWEERGEKPRENELRRQCGKNFNDSYFRGQRWPVGSDISTALIADVQGAEGGFLKWLIRQWKENGDSRCVQYGRCLDFDALRAIQEQYGISDDNVFVDSGHAASKVYAACVKWGWRPMKGDDAKDFVTYENRVPIRRPYKVTLVDPSIGKVLGTRCDLALIVFSSDAYKDRLLLHIVLGRGPVWQIPDDVTNDYCEELLAEERVQRLNPRNAVSFVWVKRGVNDFLDCELMQLVVADISGMAVAGLVGDLDAVEPQD